jgi:hypothetical protein
VSEAEPTNAGVTKVSAPVVGQGWNSGSDADLIDREPTPPDEAVHVSGPPSSADITTTTAAEPATAAATTIQPASAATLDLINEDRLDRAFERESSRRRERFLYFIVFLGALAVVVPVASIGFRVAMTAPTYMAPLLIQPVIVLTSVWLGGRLARRSSRDD